MAGRAKKTEADARLALEQAFDQIPNLRGKFKTLVEQLFTTSKQKKAWVTIVCSCCGKKRRYEVAVEVDDWNARVKAIDILMTQAKGKPAETKKLDVSVKAARTREELENASEAELLAIAAGSSAVEENT